jgi:hypothetical protein
VVPGYMAARSVKWVSKVRVSDEEAYSSWQRGMTYKSIGAVKSYHGAIVVCVVRWLVGGW